MNTNRILVSTSRLAALTLCALSAACSGSPDGSGDPTDEGATSENTAVSAVGTRSAIVDVALANKGKGACSNNSRGGRGFDSSCAGNGGLPEYWCADFARWVWAAAGVKDTDQLTAAAGSFYLYGEHHGTLSSKPEVGDVAVFDYKGNGVADHVAIVVRVDSSGTIETISGDWEGHGNTEAGFSSTSHVIVNTPAYSDKLHSWSGTMAMRVDGFVRPLGVK
jgi:hypothetical protein